MRRPASALAALALALLVAEAPAPRAAFAQAAERPDLGATFAALEAAWAARDVDAYLGLWDALDEAGRSREQTFAQAHFSAVATHLRLDPAHPLPGGEVRLGARVVTISEPRGRVEQWLLRLAPRPGGWRIVSREAAGSVDGLLHLSLDPRGYRADGLRLVLEDFELLMRKGTLYTSPHDVGPTVLVFVGEGIVRVTPKPAAEREQLRAYSGQAPLVRRVRTAFVRVHPADLRRVLQPLRLDADADAPKRLATAQQWFLRHVGRTFVLDGALPGAPWWLMPGLGDAVVTFDGPKGPLTFAVNSNEPESISLFDRERRRQVCLYPGAGGSLDYDEDADRQLDVLHHEVEARIDPAPGTIEAVARIRLRLLSPSSTLRLRLDEALSVRTVESDAGGRHLFFRVRNQNGLLVSLGALSGRVGELTLTVRYGGPLAAATIEREALQLSPPTQVTGFDEDVVVEPVAVYTNRTVWHPQGGEDDYATGRFTLSVPRDKIALLGGLRESLREQDGRVVVTWRQDLPAKYFSAAVGRFVDVARRDAAGTALEALAVHRVRRSARAALDDAAAIVEFFSREFGPAPYPRIALAVIEGVTPGGHSPPGLVILQERPVLMRGTLAEDPANFSDVPSFFLAHELAHQWWGHGVAGRNYRERWLSEGLAQYAAALWIRHSRGEGIFRAVLGRMGRWALRHTERGPISLGYRLGHVQADARIYRAIVYDKGALVLHTLRGLVGDEAFRGALRTLQRERRFQKIGTSDLRAALETASGRELAGWFEAYVHGTAIPTLSWRLQSGGAGALRLRVQMGGVPGPIPVRITWGERGSVAGEHLALIPREGGLIELPAAATTKQLAVNADWGVLLDVRRD